MDGGSTDGTVDILEANDDRIGYWESKPDRGIYHAWNKALTYAKGEWLCFLGADDYFRDERSLEKMVAPLRTERSDIVCSRVELLDEAANSVRRVGKPWNWNKMRRYQVVAHPGMLHHRRLFDKYGKFSEKYHIAGDYEFLLRLDRTTKAIFLTDCLVCVGKGVSRVRPDLVFREVREIQSNNDEIGPVRAWVNWFLAKMKTRIKKITGIRVN